MNQAEILDLQQCHPDNLPNMHDFAFKVFEQQGHKCVLLCFNMETNTVSLWRKRLTH